MIRAIVTCFIITLFLTDARASDELLPGKRFQTLQMMPQLQAALRGNDADKMRAAIKRLTLENVDAKWQLFAGMAAKIGKEIPPKEDIEYWQSFQKYVFENENGKRKAVRTTTESKQSKYDGLEGVLEELLSNRNANDLRSVLSVLYRRLIKMEILKAALHEAPDSLWVGAEYKRVITGEDIDKAWSFFNTCYLKAWDHLLPDSNEYYNGEKLSAFQDLIFVGYDGAFEQEPKRWIWSIWNALRACGRRCIRTKEDKPQMYLGQMSVRLLEYAVSPEFQTVLNHNLERRVYYRPLRTKIFEVFFYSCLACRGYWKGKPYDGFWDWKIVSAEKRTKRPALEKQLQGQVTRTVGQTVKRSLGIQSKADKRNELFDALALQKEALDKEATERLKQIEALQTELNEARAGKSAAENQAQQLKQGNVTLTAKLAALKKTHEEGEGSARERRIQDLSAQNTELENLVKQQKSDISRLEKEIEGKMILVKAHHDSYERLQVEVNEKDAHIRQLQSALSKLHDEADVQALKDLVKKLREEIESIKPLARARKAKIMELRQEVQGLKQRLNVSEMHVEMLARPAAEEDSQALEKENQEREELRQALAEQTNDERSQLKEQLASAKSFLDGSFLHNPPAQNEGDGENELFQRQAVHIIRIEDQLRMAYLHVQHLYSWCAYLEAGWNTTAVQLSALMVPQDGQENVKYDIRADDEMFKLTWPEIQACTSQYLREKVQAKRPVPIINVDNDNNDQTSKGKQEDINQ